MSHVPVEDAEGDGVSMKSGLGDRNNSTVALALYINQTKVSMKSGLGDRNNHTHRRRVLRQAITVSMKSGLRDRNNEAYS